MKLPLITMRESRQINGVSQPEEIFHVLKLDGLCAIGVGENTLQIEMLSFIGLRVLSESEYQEWKENAQG